MYKIHLLFLSVFFISFSTFSQVDSQKKIYSWYDTQNGIENSMLFRGIEYVETDRMINERHKFFKTDKFQKGALMYDGQTFYEVPLKYNIFNDLLLVNLQQGSRNLIFQLISNKVDNFMIGEHQFKYLKSRNNIKLEGFYEVINDQGEFKIYKKHLQNSREIRDKNLAYTEFNREDPEYIYQIGSDNFSLGSRSELMSNFPEFKRQIRSFYKENHFQKLKNPLKT